MGMLQRLAEAVVQAWNPSAAAPAQPVREATQPAMSQGDPDEANWRRLTGDGSDRYLVGLSSAATGIYNDDYKDLSATLSYDFSDRLSFKLEGNNLLDSEQRTFDGYDEGLRTNVVFGRSYKASLTYRF